jgi:hypothetical protein
MRQQLLNDIITALALGLRLKVGPYPVPKDRNSSFLNIIYRHAKAPIHSGKGLTCTN